MTSPTAPTTTRVRAKQRRGDRIFRGFAMGAGILILVILALVAAFLLPPRLAGLVRGSGQKRWISQGYGEFWS